MVAPLVPTDMALWWYIMYKASCTIPMVVGVTGILILHLGINMLCLTPPNRGTLFIVSTSRLLAYQVSQMWSSCLGQCMASNLSCYCGQYCRQLFLLLISPYFSFFWWGSWKQNLGFFFRGLGIKLHKTGSCFKMTVTYHQGCISESPMFSSIKTRDFMAGYQITQNRKLL